MLKSLFVGITFLLTTSLTTSFAADAPKELTLNDIPALLQKMRGCETLKGILSDTKICKLDSNQVWVGVGNGDPTELTLFYNKTYGTTVYASGHTVKELLVNFAHKLNESKATEKILMDAITPYLPTQ